MRHLIEAGPPWLLPLVVAVVVAAARRLRPDDYDCGVRGCRQRTNSYHRHDGTQIRRYSL